MYQIEASKTKLIILSWVLYASVLTSSMTMFPEHMMDGYIKTLAVVVIVYCLIKTFQALYSLIVFSSRVPRSAKTHLSTPIWMLLGVAWFLGYVLYKML